MTIDIINKMYQSVVLIHRNLVIHELLMKSSTSISNEGEING